MWERGHIAQNHSHTCLLQQFLKSCQLVCVAILLPGGREIPCDILFVQQTMPCKIALAIQQRVPILFYDLSYSADDISVALGISKAAVYKVLRHVRSYGTPYNLLAQPCGWKRLLQPQHLDFIQNKLDENPVFYLDEIQDLLRIEYDLSVSISAMYQTLQDLDLVRMPVTKAAAERNKVLCARFLNHAGTLVHDLSQVLFLDETAKDNKTFTRHYGRAPKGSRCHNPAPFVRGTCLSLLPALSTRGIECSIVFEGSVTADRFYIFLRDYVVHVFACYKIDLII